ncbi:dynamin family protein [Methyloradius palustris]|uniref:Dynamin N-terminal domain-containing protein n=1 Tax=Methyloradius palustris TaxID=2778876 RepID=A0A8D5G0S2_9PROT|nr:dynamin family protein [Methyloradius palustris]BCM25742.1 hypothetical protein ZMTM_20010 [Methyloradius palustris]
MSADLLNQIGAFQIWRDDVSQTISDYRDWLDATKTADALQDLRLYDMSETLKKDQIVLAFVAEFSRGKTETINALFFSDFNQRLLPSDPGRTTMCPTEIFWSDKEEPCIKLLPIETRKTDDTLTYLKSNPNNWTKIRLDLNSPDLMKEAFSTVVQQKEVSLDVARELGLWNEEDIVMVQALASKGKVDIPVWRHALINYPHPLLKSGLVILDTPGLNTLGTEPELTLRIIPNAHAVIFLLATDTGVTKSDMQIWTDYIRNRASRKIAVLNKIDILWDDMKTADEIAAMIQSQIDDTARQLKLPTSLVLAISAQKALVAKIKKDDALLVRSGIQQVEQLLAESVIGAKHEILSHTVINETTNMLKASRKVAQQRLIATRDQALELESLRGKNTGEVQAILSRVDADRRLYEGSVRTFNVGSQEINKIAENLLSQLNQDYLNTLLEMSREEIGDSWTTIGLNRGLKSLIKQTTELGDRITLQGSNIKKSADELYELFKKAHGFDIGTPAPLSMDGFNQAMHGLDKLTEEFCNNPVNVMTEKRFLVRKFYHHIGGEVQSIFASAFRECEQWFNMVLKPLKQQIAEHKVILDQRTQSLMQAHQDQQTLQANLDKLTKEFALQKEQSAQLDQMLLKLVKASKSVAVETTAPQSSPATVAPEFMDTIKLNKSPLADHRVTV